MTKYTTLTLSVAVLFALAVAMPASAITVDTDVASVTTDGDNTTVTTEQATVKTTKNSATVDALLAKFKAKFAAKKNTSATVEAKESRALGTSLKGVDASCIVKLVDAREVSIQDAWATFNTSMSDALKARHTALVTAWGEEEVTDRTDGIKTAMKTWQAAHKAMFAKLKTDKKEAWNTFKTKAKAECKVTVPAEEKLTSDGTGTVAL